MGKFVDTKKPAIFRHTETGWITAHLDDGSRLRSQSVEAHLLFAILYELKKSSQSSGVAKPNSVTGGDDPK